VTANSPIRLVAVVSAVAVALALGASSARVVADEPALRLRAVVSTVSPETLTIELLRWSTDAERRPLLAALSAPAPVLPAAADAEGARGGRAGRGGRGGRGAAAPATPAARLTAAIKAAPTVGFIWGEGSTGYAIKYAWRAALPDGRERVVLATDRRLGAHATGWPAVSPAAADQEFTVIEMRLTGAAAGDPPPRAGSPAAVTGEGKTSLHSNVILDAAASTLALESYDAAPRLLTVTR
jgi:hypothetical protein